jgi:hypothetical protein
MPDEQGCTHAYAHKQIYIYCVAFRAFLYMTAIITPTHAQVGLIKKVNCARVGVIIAVIYLLLFPR